MYDHNITNKETGEFSLENYLNLLANDEYVLLANNRINAERSKLYKDESSAFKRKTDNSLNEQITTNTNDEVCELSLKKYLELLSKDDVSVRILHAYNACYSLNVHV